MRQTNAILGLLAQTSIHAGAGASISAIDLPIQREGHNGWPCVFGSAIKGALRAKAEATASFDDKMLSPVFGPDTKNAADHAGAISVGDARLVLLPMRSLTSTFKWVTCVEALQRLQRDAELLSLSGPVSQFKVPARPKDTDESCNALVPKEGSITDLSLEEFRFTAKQEDLADVITALASLMRRDDAEAELRKRLVIVSDDMFSFLVQHATPVTAHIAINNDTKTVRDGALWYEETLPPETLLYVPLMAAASRNKDGKVFSAAEIRQSVIKDLLGDKKNCWLQVGGNETVGMGWCGVEHINSGE